MVAVLLLLPTMAAAATSAIECGVASGVFQQAPQAAETAVKTVWGQANIDNFAFLRDQEGDLLGYNEPDLYGPPCCNCKGKQRYYPATSSGWIALFNPTSAAKYWQATVNNVTRPGVHPSRRGVRRIVSPAMANGAKPAPGVDCTADPSKAGNPLRCEGWLSMFKQATLQLACTRFDGSSTNCWDVIDAIQVHSYAARASDVFDRLEEYHQEFADDFAGSGGRTPKVLWLTEVAAGSSDPAVVAPFAADLMAPDGGLSDRTKFGYVSRVSWFSEFFFPAFNLTHAPPARDNENWVSSLFQPFGGLTKAGESFFEHCASA